MEYILKMAGICLSSRISRAISELLRGICFFVWLLTEKEPGFSPEIRKWKFKIRFVSEIRGYVMKVTRVLCQQQ